MSDANSPSHEKIIWKANEFDYYPKTTTWYIVFWSLVTVVLFISLWERNILFVLFTLIASGMVLFWAHKKPRLLTITLSDEALIVNEKKYHLKEFVGYYLTDEVLILQHTYAFSAYLKIRVQTQFRDRIDAILNRHMNTFEYSESLIDALARFIGF